MKLVTNNPDGWEAIINAISAITEEAVIHFKPTGVYFSAVDTSKVSMVSFLWDKSKFELYDVPEETKIGVSTKELQKIIKRARDKTTLLDKDGHITFIFGEKLEYVIPQLPAAAIIEKEPVELKNEIQFIIPTKDFGRIIGDISTISKYFTLSSEEGTLYASANDDNTSKMREIIDTGDKVKDKVKSSYDLGELETMFGVLSKHCDEIQIGFSSEAPIQIIYKTKSVGDITYLLAPKRED